MAREDEKGVIPVMHGLWDFGVISAAAVASKSYPGAGLLILWHRIGPAWNADPAQGVV